MSAIAPRTIAPRKIARVGLPQRRVSLCETLDRVLNKGAVVTGDIVISVADIDLLYIGVNLVVASVETIRQGHAEGRVPATAVEA